MKKLFYWTGVGQGTYAIVPSSHLPSTLLELFALDENFSCQIKGLTCNNSFFNCLAIFCFHREVAYLLRLALFHGFSCVNEYTVKLPAVCKKCDFIQMVLTLISKFIV